MNENEISKIIIECAIKVHTNLGPGLLESVYERTLSYELVNKGLFVECQKPIPVIYDNIEIGEAFRADIVVNDKVIIEIKSVDELNPVHYKQLQTYLKLSDKKLGLLINFNKKLLKEGIKRIINGEI
ncbi:MAG: GxxExxY protein [Bacteroidales bacterium]